MNYFVLIFLFAFNFNIVIMFLGNITELLTKSDRQGMLPSLRDLWLKRGIAIFLWGLIAKLIQVVIPISSLFIPTIIVVYILIHTIVWRISPKIHMFLQIDKLLTDPLIIIPMLIAGYLDITFIELFTIFWGIWMGIGISVLILLSIRKRIILEECRSVQIMLFSLSLLSMILLALRQAINI